jgi:uncharacterized phiE125 gp8 family phage protein
MNRVKVITGPSSEPVTLAEAKLHLREDGDDQDSVINTFIGAATAHCEAFLGRALISRTLDYFIDAFPSDNKPAKLPLPPLISVTGVFYTDADGVEQEFTDFETDTAHEPGRIYLAPSVSWPTPRDSEASVRIRYRAGYVDTDPSPDTGSVPDDIKAAILLTIGTLYENRETIVIGQSAILLPWSAEQLLRRHRVELSAA